MGDLVYATAANPTRSPGALPAGAITLAGHAGSNAVAFDGLLGSGKKLPRGHYTAALTASASGLSSRR